MDNSTQKVSLVETIPPEIFAFLDSLLMDAGLDNIDASMYDTMIEELYVRLDKFLIAQIVENLPEDKLEEFANFMEKAPTAVEVQEFLSKNMPDAQGVFADAFGTFREQYLKGVKTGFDEFDSEQEDDGEEEQGVESIPSETSQVQNQNTTQSTEEKPA